MGNTVTLTFAGDSKSLERTFDKVGSGAKDMAADLDKASVKARDFGGSMDRAGDAAGTSEGAFMGTADVLDGLATTMGFNIGPQIELARGFGDIAGGLSNLGPLIGQAIGKFGTMIGLTGAQAAATGTATGAQWSLNAALSANPIGAVVLALTLLAGGLILAWQKSETFRDIVKGAFNLVKESAQTLWDFIGSLPDKIWGLAERIKNALIWPYKEAFNLVSKVWNNTVGKLSFEIPSWVPGMGGKGFSMPQLPTFHMGGVVPGNPGQAVPILAMAGETVTRAGGGAGTVINIQAGAIVTENQLADLVQGALLRKQQRTGSLGFA